MVEPTRAEKNECIAMACGFKHEIDDKGYHWWLPPNKSEAFGYGQSRNEPPNFFTDPKACFEAIEKRRYEVHMETHRGDVIFKIRERAGPDYIAESWIGGEYNFCEAMAEALYQAVRE